MDTQSFDGWLFSWTNDELAIKDVQAFLKKAANSIPAIDALKFSDITDTAGPGLHAIGNSIDAPSSGSSGKILVAVKWKPGQKMGLLSAADPQQSFALMKAHTPALLYFFPGANLSAWAVVVRSPEVLDLSSARSFDFRTGRLFEELDFSSLGTKLTSPDSMIHWARYAEFLADFPELESRPTNSTVSQEDYFRLLHQEVKQAPKKLVDGLATLSPIEKNIFGKALTRNDLFLLTLTNALFKDEPNDQELLAVATKLFSAAGYLDKQPVANHKEFKERMVARWIANKAVVNNAKVFFERWTEIISAIKTFHLESLKVNIATLGLKADKVLSTITSSTFLLESPDGKPIAKLERFCRVSRLLSKDGWMNIQLTNDEKNPSNIRGKKGWVKAQYIVGASAD